MIVYRRKMIEELVVKMSIKENLIRIKEEIQESLQSRPVSLLAVSKTFTPQAIEQAIQAGQMAFGENYVQEAVDKILYFKQNYPQLPLEWHMIGPIQSNKTRLIAENFDWVHSVDREKIARRLSEQRPKDKAPLNVLVEVNIDCEASKSGIEVTEVEPLLGKIAQLPSLKLRGLMCIPDPNLSEASRVQSFRKMKSLFDELNTRGYALDVLSMGMSADFILAIKEGSTMVRVGSAIFGVRDYSKKKLK